MAVTSADVTRPSLLASPRRSAIGGVKLVTTVVPVVMMFWGFVTSCGRVASHINTLTAPCAGLKGFSVSHVRNIGLRGLAGVVVMVTVSGRKVIASDIVDMVCVIASWVGGVFVMVASWNVTTDQRAVIILSPVMLV